MSLINREALLAEYDRVHVGEPGNARKLIVDAPTVEPERKWIPVTERLPGEDGVYIVYAPYYTGGSSTAKENHEGIMFSRYKNKKWSIEHGYYKRPNCVIAWMPLPESYQAERQEK